MNDNTINFLKHTFNENRNSHAFLMETNNLEKCLNDIIKLIFDINNISREIILDNIPDIKIIFPDGREIKRDQIKPILEEFQTFPIELKHRYYIIVQSDAMNLASANTILKFLEEPDNVVVGFFITQNKGAMINTIVSRCQHFKFIYDLNKISNLDTFNEFLKNMDVNEIYKKIIFLNDFVRKERIENINFFKELKSYLISTKFSDLVEIKVLVKRINLLDNVIERLLKNANRELVILDLAKKWK